MYYKRLVGGLANVELDAVDAELDRSAEGAERIFSHATMNAAVSEDLRHASSQARDQELQPLEIGQIT
jgi:hypothetical protein